jgi:hypothetical protein
MYPSTSSVDTQTPPPHTHTTQNKAAGSALLAIHKCSHTYARSILCTHIHIHTFHVGHGSLQVQRKDIHATHQTYPTRCRRAATLCVQACHDGTVVDDLHTKAGCMSAPGWGRVACSTTAHLPPPPDYQHCASRKQNQLLPDINTRCTCGQGGCDTPF